MTSRELFDALQPNKTIDLTAQLLGNGLNVNMSGVYSQLIKEAARCNNYNSDVVYDIEDIMDRLKEFRAGDEWKPIFIGFRRHGVDGTSFVLSRIGKLENRYNVIYDEYFALYAVDVEQESEGWYKVNFCTYYT